MRYKLSRVLSVVFSDELTEFVEKGILYYLNNVLKGCSVLNELKNN